MAAAAAVRQCRGAAAVARPLAVARPCGAAAAARVRRTAVRAADEAKASSIARLDALLGKPEVAAPAAEPAQEQREAAEPAAEQDAAPVPPADVGALYASLGAACDAGDVSATRSAMAALSEAGVAGLYGSATGTLRRRTTSMADLSSVGIKQPESIATPEERDDQGFLTTVLLTCSVLAVAGGFLPGDWGFFVPYLTGAIVLVVLAVGSTAPGLMYAVVDNITGAAQRANEGPEGERTLRHEAAHMLVSYCLGTPVISYSLDLGAEHTDLAEASLDRPLALKLIDDAELDRLAVMAMAGVAAEGLEYDQVKGGTADLFDLQRLINRARNGLNAEQQQSIARWAVKEAALVLRREERAYDALREAMARGASVPECIQAIEGAR
eukprot:PRCOL_00002642-RA